MAKISDTVWGSTEDRMIDRVSNCAELLLKTIRVLDSFASPKQFHLLSSRLVEFASMPSNESRHSIRIEWPIDSPINEVAGWEVWGSIGGKTVRVTAYSVFHTYTNNHSGSCETLINGKDSSLKPEYGGLTIDDLWEESGKWSYNIAPLAI